MGKLRCRGGYFSIGIDSLREINDHLAVLVTLEFPIVVVSNVQIARQGLHVNRNNRNATGFSPAGDKLSDFPDYFLIRLPFHKQKLFS